MYMEKKSSGYVTLVIFIAALVIFIDGFIWFAVKPQLNRIENAVVVSIPTPSPSIAVPSETVTASPSALPTITVAPVGRKIIPVVSGK